MFFENLLMNADHELKNRYLHIDYISEDEVQSANYADSKCKNCTLEELAIINELIKNPMHLCLNMVACDEKIF